MAEVLSSCPGGTGVLRKATVPTCLLDGPVAGSDPAALVRVDVAISDGLIKSVVPHDPSGSGGDDLDGGLVLPSPIDMHTHLDKGHIWPRQPNPDGTFMGALTSVGEDRLTNWSAEDVRRRMEFGLRSAHAHGTAAIRTHLDSLPPQEDISWPVFDEMRADWAGRIDLQGVCLFGIDRLDADDGYLEKMTAMMVRHRGIMGAVTYMIDRLDEHLDAVFKAASENGLDLDFHVDETEDPAAVTLKHIAEAALRNGYEGQIVCGHCCSLARQSEADADRTLDLVAQAGIGVVSLPMCNMYLQDRYAGRTPRWRGVTLLHEMKARGIQVAVASDNTRDPFYAYGDLDLIEVHAQAVRILHLDHPHSDWISAVTTAPAAMTGFDAGRIVVGKPADLLAFRARDWNELLSRFKGPRDVLRGGKLIDRTLPDFRELDDIMGERQGQA